MSKALTRLPNVSSTSRTPSAATTLPFGNQRSSATAVAAPSGSTRYSLVAATGSPDVRSKPKFPTHAVDDHVVELSGDALGEVGVGDQGPVGLAPQDAPVQGGHREQAAVGQPPDP